MFADATSFNQSLNDWNVSNVAHMKQMFIRATAFNQPLNKWNVSKFDDRRRVDLLRVSKHAARLQACCVCAARCAKTVRSKNQQRRG